MKNYNFNIIDSKFVNSICRIKSPIVLFISVFLLTFIIQGLISLLEGTFFSRSNIDIPFTRHLTILLGGSIFIPLIITTIYSFYRNFEKRLAILNLNHIIQLDYYSKKIKNHYNKKIKKILKILSLILVVIFDYIQYLGMSKNENYVHFLNNKMTFCGIYYTIIFIIITYFVIIFCFNLLLFCIPFYNLCKFGDVRIAIKHPDEKYGLLQLHQLFINVLFIFSLIGFYFIIMFLNWVELKSFNELFGNIEAIVIICCYFSGLSLVIWFFVTSINKLILNSRKRLSEETYKLSGLKNFNIFRTSELANIFRAIHHDGTSILLEEISKIKSFYSFSNLLKIYTLIIIPVIIPIAIEIFKIKLLNE